MTDPITIPESPYAAGGEFGPEIERPVVQRPPRVVADPSLYFRVPQFADEARAAAKGQATATGVPGFTPPALKPISESALAKAVDAVEAARDRLMRSRRGEPS